MRNPHLRPLHKRLTPHQQARRWARIDFRHFYRTAPVPLAPSIWQRVRSLFSGGDR